jgi:N-acetyl-1-D-myo-inositol-2-amino-2-deoxy-alpha-D-glucopyranoside deacetylase
MSETERVLFVHAHPDDESLTTGGTIATLIDRGANVTVLTCTRGEQGEVIPDDLQYALHDRDTLTGLRETELRSAMAALGVTDHRFLGSPDARWSGRQPRRYLDSGMKWGENGAEAADEIDVDSLTAAEQAEVAADIAAVILDVKPQAVISYDETGGYGHPDHVRAFEAAQRAAEVYDVPFFAIKPSESTDASLLSVDVTPVLDRKRAALEAYRSQVVVDGDDYLLSNGSRHPIDHVEKFARTGATAGGELPFTKHPWSYKIALSVLAFAVGAVSGALLTVFHQTTLTIGSVAVPTGLIIGLLIVAALLIGLRVLYATRVVSFWAAVGIIGAVALFSAESPGGSVLVQAGVTGTVWALGPTVIAFLVLAWPQIQRRPAGKLEQQTEAKGPPLQ